ncbi:FkbM family methyltransferase [Saccharopolyspora sp. NFXS83]|uniref:FkbM family methyltransferase n=1 Tax=Saccharopolyspora sp. NFXS83 TaxID=2993560 RepID=UPI00224AAEFA|nr:FkbM family methyltransferase [Saccharopolyspora sp. NFXS83]MCX2731853.1 FkbM family methyltransferase [Saccharopolyspora sp. NFXS83]
MTDSQPQPEPSGDPDAEATSDLLEHRADEPAWPAEHPDAAAGFDADQATLIGCTVAGPGQLPAARVLRESFLHSHPGARFVVLPIGGEIGGDVLTPERIGVDADELAGLAVACTADQLRAVLRPRLLQHLLATGATVLYLEPSVQVFSEFDDLLRELSPDRPVALVPRVLRTLYADGFRPSATDLVESGPFDPSVLGVRPGAEDFLTAWADQVRADPSVGMLLDGAPALIDHHVLRDPGVGLSVWNAAQRELIPTGDGGHAVDGSQLRSIHFDGFQPQRPWLLSTHYADRPRVLLSEHPVLAGLCAAYRNKLVEAGYTREQPHPYDALPDGTPLPEPLRRDYLDAWQRDQAPASPFATGADVEDFLDWACAPVDERQRGTGGSRWTAAVWADDQVLRKNYPDPFGADADAFREWCAGVGVAGGRVPAGAVRNLGGTDGSTLVDQLGVAVLGTGRTAELVRAAVRASGLPSADTPYYPVVLRCEPGLTVPAGRHLIDVQPDTTEADGAVEAWVLSEAARQAARRAGGPTTRVVALPLLDPGPVDLPTRKAARARFGLSEEFVIGAFADHSDERRDNILGLVTAFFAAFPEREDAHLLVAVTAAAEHPEAAERLRLATAADPRVHLVEEEIGTEGLLSAADAVASLHRPTGGDRYALRLLEVAAHGVPVLAADHGAVTELLSSAGAILVPCQGQGEPDVEAAAVALRTAADDPEETAAAGRRARDHLLVQHSVNHAAERLREHVEHAYRNWRTKWAKDRHGDLDDPLHPLLVARHALHRAPDVGAGGRNSVAPALRKAVLRVLSHYDEHIRDVLRSMVDGVEQTAAELLRRQYDADGGGEELDLLRTELGRIDQRHDELDERLTSTDDGMVRARADLADQHRRLRALEAGGGSPGGEPDHNDLLAQRLDSLTGAVERTLDRIDALESEREQVRDQELETTLRSATSDAAYALHRTDVLQRILLREHERNTGTADGSSTPVLCDAGLLRLPADDAMMLPWLSSHATWDAEVSGLIDSLLEPDGVFLDVGSYVGYQTVRVLSRLGNSGAVIAVEPSADGRALLNRNVEVNVPTAWGHRLVTLAAAAWDAPADLIAEPSLAGGVSVRPVEESDSEDDEARVPGVRLDKELENTSTLHDMTLSVVHVDVGARVHRVLGGLVRLLRRDRPSIVCSFTPSGITELGDDPATALREFGTWGYELVPVGRTTAVSASELLEAIDAAGSTSTVKLWLRPKGKS